MDKSPEAFRTISEVAEALDVPPHVLRFWETRFAQVKPVKRGGGRRYYRPEDVRLLRGIRGLLYDDGMTIKGVQKILRERGIRHVIGLGTVPDAETEPEPMAAAAGLAPAPGSGAFEAPAPNGIRRPQRDLFEPQPQAQVAGAVAQLASERETRPLDKEALRALIEQLKALRKVMTEEPSR
jgi:DNA-binding transcriptional MerR regulator